jgi:hypothetical protein
MILSILLSAIWQDKSVGKKWSVAEMEDRITELKEMLDANRKERNDDSDEDERSR